MTASVAELLPQAMKLQLSGDVQEAQALYHKILEMSPNQPETLDLLGVMELQKGNAKEAQTLIERALEAQPDNVRFSLHLADAYLAQDNAAGAKVVLDAILAQDPSHGDAVGKRITLARQEKDFAAILNVIDPLLEQHPHQPDLLKLKREALLECERFAEAAGLFELALASQPMQDAVFHHNYGRSLSGSGAFRKAITQLERAHALDPLNADTMHNLGYVYYFLGEHEQAITWLRQAVSSDPEHHQARFLLGQLRLMTTDFREGYDDFAARFHTGVLRRREYPFPVWQGEPLKGKRLLVWLEQGTGDIVMFSGFFQYLLDQQPERLLIEMYPQMIPLISRSFPELELHPFAPNMDPEVYEGGQFDYECPIGDIVRHCLPHYVPCKEHGPHLKADPDKVAHYRDLLKKEAGEGHLVGISWFTTNKKTAQVRNIPLSLWAPLLRTPGCTFVSLQYENTQATMDIDLLKQDAGIDVTRFDMDMVRDNDDYAALVAALDEVISIQNTNVHMAAALGIPVTLLLSCASDYRWRKDTDDNFWYRGVTIERQAEPLKWTPVIERVAARLAKGRL